MRRSIPLPGMASGSVARKSKYQDELNDCPISSAQEEVSQPSSLGVGDALRMAQHAPTISKRDLKDDYFGMQIIEYCMV